MDTEARPQKLSDLQKQLVDRVEKEVGEIPAASLELAFRNKARGQRLCGISAEQLYKIGEIAQDMGVRLPTRER